MKSKSDDAAVAGVELTHPSRVLYLAQGITKSALARYYQRVAEWILPHLEGRPLTLVRCPEGHNKECFYQRHPREGASEAMNSLAVRENGKVARYLSVDSLPGLIALVQMGTLELHTWGARMPNLDRPDRMIFDLDPAQDVDWQHIAAGAQRLRACLEVLDLGAFVKTTGGKGLHIVVPIAPKQSWDFVKNFSRALAESMVRQSPDRYVATMSKTKRGGKIFIDYLRNNRTATAVSAYSTRARAGAPVSVPLRWEELQEDRRNHFTIHNVPERLARPEEGSMARLRNDAPAANGKTFEPAEIDNSPGSALAN
jgi:bifunctional non-homologous end joining protein LigD